MSKVLCVVCNPKSTEDSRSQLVASHFLDEYKKTNPHSTIETINLFEHPISRIDNDVLNGWKKLRTGVEFENLNTDEKLKVKKIDESTHHFASFEKYLFITPMWNLGFPAELKMYIDSVCVAGKTFAYTAAGPVGLLNDQGKKCMLIHAIGGFHQHKPEDHSEPYLRSIINFMGIESFDSLVVEGVDALPAQSDIIINKAIEKAKIMAREF